MSLDWPASTGIEESSWLPQASVNEVSKLASASAAKLATRLRSLSFLMFNVNSKSQAAAKRCKLRHHRKFSRQLLGKRDVYRQRCLAFLPLRFHRQGLLAEVDMGRNWRS